MGLNMSTSSLMLMSKMDSLNVIIILLQKQCNKKHHANIVMHVLNRTMTQVLDGLTIFEKWIRDKLNISHSRVFGCFAYKHILKKL
jgi:hypothetical protein